MERNDDGCRPALTNGNMISFSDPETGGDVSWDV